MRKGAERFEEMIAKLFSFSSLSLSFSVCSSFEKESAHASAARKTVKVTRLIFLRSSKGIVLILISFFRILKNKFRRGILVSFRACI